MDNFKNGFGKRFVIVPMLPLLTLSLQTFPLSLAMQNMSVADIAARQEAEQAHLEKIQKINDYFEARKMPLLGYGEKFLSESEKNNLDWRLLPAIAILESGGGKYACGNNPFGWGSCKINFKSTDEAIEIVAWNLGGGNPNTAAFYSGEIAQKLYSYNGSVSPRYAKKILRLMSAIEG